MRTPRRAGAALSHGDPDAQPIILTDRRRFIATLAVGAAAFTVRGAFAEQLARTAAETEGPFYPDRLPLDTDNDLLIVNDGITPAVGEITHLSGRILDETGAAIRNAVVENLAVRPRGRLYPLRRRLPQGARWKLPGLWPFPHRRQRRVLLSHDQAGFLSRAQPHIHFKVKKGGRELLTTQCYIKGHPGNAQDGIWKSVTDPRARESITIDFKPATGSRPASSRRPSISSSGGCGCMTRPGCPEIYERSAAWRTAASS